MKKLIPLYPPSPASRQRLLTACVLLLTINAAGNAPAAGEKAALPENTGSSWIKRTADVLVSGTVQNAKGERLIGVTVMAKGTIHGTTTNEKGVFQLTVPEHAVLVASYVGYQTKEIPVNGQSTINILLEPANTGINEVVVVGYGTQKKISVTGAISSIPVSTIQQTPAPSLSNAISGKLPGIITRQAIGEPGYDQAQVYIRGLSTWVTATPLILIDGVERDMNNINAQEIESFTILKDASATAVYGVRGANGVILINTKRGKIGKPQVSFRSETALLQSLRLPEYINAFQYASLMNEARAFGGQDPYWSAEQLRKFRDGSDPNFYPDVDWTNTVFKKQTGQSINNVSVTGGNSFIRYYTNVGFTWQDGIYKDDKSMPYSTNASMKRYNFRSNVDITLSKSLTMQLGIGGIIQNGSYPSGGSSHDIFHTLRVVPPIAFPVKNPDGSPASSPAYPGNGLNQNPWAFITKSGYLTQDRGTLQGTFGVRWDLSDLVTPGLSVGGKFSYDRYNQADNNRHKLYEVKQYTGKDPVTGEDKYNLIREEQPMSYDVNGTTNRAIYTEVQLNYDRTIDKHNITGMALFNRRDYVDLTADVSLNNLPYRRQGLSARATYSYANRYLAELNFGYNGSENFPKGRRYGFFPSVSAGWIISNEAFWHVAAISNLKIRGSYGQVGNDQVGGRRFLDLTTVNTGGQSYLFGINQQGYQGIDESLIGNPDVTWEVATKANIGLDMDLFNDMVSLQLDAFRENRKGILLQRGTIPRILGIYPWSIPYANLGRVKNEGLDALLEVKKTTSSGWYFSGRANFTYAHNVVIENDEPLQKYAYQSAKGKMIDQRIGYIAEGLYQSQDEIDKGPKSSFVTNLRPGDIKYKDVNGDGIIDTYDRVAIGYPRTPEITYGFGGTTAYKNFDVSVYFTGAAHTSIFLEGWGMWPFYDGFGTNNVSQEYYDNRWTPEHRDALYPAVDLGHNPNNFLSPSTLWMRSGNFIRLKNAEIGYTLREKSMGRYGINQVRFFINGTNLVTWDKAKIIDPESNNGTGYYPLQRAWNFGLQVDFK